MELFLFIGNNDMTPDQKYNLFKLLIQVGLPMIGVLVAGFGGAIVGALWSKYLTYVENTEDFIRNCVNPLFLSIEESKLTISKMLEAVGNLKESEEVKKRIRESKEILDLTTPPLIGLRKSVLTFIRNGFSIDISTSSFYTSVFFLYSDLRSNNSSMTNPRLSYESIVSMRDRIESISKQLEHTRFEPEGFLPFLWRHVRFSLKGRKRGKLIS